MIKLRRKVFKPADSKKEDTLKDTQASPKSKTAENNSVAKARKEAGAKHKLIKMVKGLQRLIVKIQEGRLYNVSGTTDLNSFDGLIGLRWVQNESSSHFCSCYIFHIGMENCVQFWYLDYTVFLAIVCYYHSADVFLSLACHDLIIDCFFSHVS